MGAKLRGTDNNNNSSQGSRAWLGKMAMEMRFSVVAF